MTHYKYLFEKKHRLIINFFSENGFGNSNPIKSYLSLLKPIDRVVILEQLFDEGIRNTHLLDKLVLAYVKVGRVDLAKEVINWAENIGRVDLVNEINWAENIGRVDLVNEINWAQIRNIIIYEFCDFIFELKFKLDISIPPERTDKWRITEIQKELNKNADYNGVKEVEFLKLLIKFIEC